MKREVEMNEMNIVLCLIPAIIAILVMAWTVMLAVEENEKENPERETVWINGVLVSVDDLKPTPGIKLTEEEETGLIENGYFEL